MGGISWKEAQLLPSKMAYFKLLILLVPGILGQTQHFKKRKTFGSDLCFEAKIQEIVAYMGPDGTDDDVTVEFCGDVDVTQCCTTPVLESRNILKDDWKKNSNQTFKASKFGKCKDQVYKIKKDMKVTLKKSQKKKKIQSWSVLNARIITLGELSYHKKPKHAKLDPTTIHKLKRLFSQWILTAPTTMPNSKSKQTQTMLPVKLNCLALLMIGVKAIRKFGSEKILELAKTSFTRSQNIQPSVFQKLEKTI